MHDLGEPALVLLPNAPIAGAPLLVTATDSTPWRAIAAGLARACGDARLVETTHPQVTRVPTVTRPTGAPTLDPDIVRRIIRAHLDETRRCKDEARQRDPAVSGRLAIRFRVGKIGKVTSAAVVASSVTDKAIGPCLAAAIRRWRFPRPEGGNFETIYPFVLEPGASDPG